MHKTRTGLIAVGTVAFLILGACGRGGGASSNAAPTAGPPTVNAGATAGSTGTSTPAAQEPAPRAADAAGQASRAFIDPVTGQLREPTAAELAALQKSQSTEQALKPPAPPPAQTRLPDGTIMYDMRNQPQVEEKVCVQADGSIGACPAKKRVAP